MKKSSWKTDMEPFSSDLDRNNYTARKTESSRKPVTAIVKFVHYNTRKKNSSKKQLRSIGSNIKESLTAKIIEMLKEARGETPFY